MKLIRDIWNYRYTRVCFKDLARMVAVKYKLVYGGKTYLPRMTPLGVLYLWVAVPMELKEKPQVDGFLREKLLSLNEDMEHLNLYGTVKLTVDFFIVEPDPKSVAVKSDDDVEQLICLVKYVPVFTSWNFRAMIKYAIILGVVGFLIWRLWPFISPILTR
jgi:hypothetical protein